MSYPRDQRDAPEFEIPDLDLPPQNPRQSQSALRAVRQPSDPVSGAALRGAVSARDFSEELTAGPSLELELSASISQSNLPAQRVDSAAHAARGLDLDAESAAPALALVVAPEGRADWPSGVSPERARLVLDPNEIQRVAGYGKPSSLGPLNAVYALRVALRKRALKAALRELDPKLSAAELRRDTLLAELTLALRSELEANSRFRPLLAPLAELDARTTEHGGELEALAAERARELAKFDAELAAMDRELATEHALSSELEALLATRELAFQRLEARQKRILIELRSLDQREASAQDANARAALGAEAEALRPGLEAARTAFDAARNELEQRRHAQRESERRSVELAERRRRVDERFARERAHGQRNADETAERRRNVLADVARTLLKERGAAHVEDAALDALIAADAEVEHWLRQSELRLRALDCCDAQKLATGHAWLLGIGAALAGLLAYEYLF